MLIHMDRKGVPPTQQEIQADLESGNLDKQSKAMKKLIVHMLNGETYPDLLMTVIRFVVVPSNEHAASDHELKKLACLYWENVSKHSEDGKLLPETFMVVNAILQNLKHANEYVRAYTLRFLCRVKEAEIVEPLIAAVKENLEHRHALVRRTAVMCVFQIAKEFKDELLPDADELIEKLLQNETDAGTRRNAFLMLYQCSQDKAIDYFAQNLDSVSKFGDGFQLVILELTRRVCRTDPSQKSRFIKIIFQLLQSPSSAVCYEAAWTLVSLSSAPTAVRAAAQTYTQLLNAESDNNVKLIVLEKLGAMRKHHAKVLQELLMDVLRALNSPNSAIRRKTLSIVMELVSPRNVGEVMLVLKKEILKTQSKDVDKESASEYRKMLVKAIHTCAIKFATVADSVVHVLMDFLSSEGAIDVILFVREIVEVYPKLRVSVLNKLNMILGEIKNAQVYRVALWILGEYTETKELRDDAVEAIYTCLGDLPFLGDAEKQLQRDENEDELDEESITQALSAPTTKVTVLADGTYATQTAFTSSNADKGVEDDSGPTLRKLMLAGNYLLGAAAIGTLTKIALRMANESGAESPDVKSLIVKVLITCCSMIQAGKAGKGTMRMDKDSYERLSFCMRTLMDPSIQQDVSGVFLEESRQVFSSLVEVEHKLQKEKEEGNKDELIAQPDSLINFRQLKARRALGADDIDLDDEATLSAAAGSDKKSGFAEQLAHVYQLTGFSDPVYAETQITVHEYDIVLDILVINRTSQTLSNLTVELSTVGDLKLVERPQSYNIGPNDHRRFKANIKVSSTETGQIFGTIVYDSSTSSSSTVVNLNEIPVEIMDYIRPASCSDSLYRQMWAEFEWENKVGVNTLIEDVDEFLDHIIESTNMNCLTPRFEPGQSTFLAANLYAKSVFGEDALVNVSVEKVGTKVEGYIRIRAKTQGIALSIGDRITFVQKTKATEKKL